MNVMNLKGTKRVRWTAGIQKLTALARVWVCIAAHPEDYVSIS